MTTDAISFKLVGAKEAQDALKSLTTRDKIKLYYRLNRRAGNIVRKHLRQSAPSQRAKKNVMVKKSRYNPTGVYVGFSKAVFFVSFLELGTQVRTTKGRGKVQKKSANRGMISPKPFVNVAHNRAAAEIQTKIGENYQRELNKGLEAELKKVRKKIAKYST